MTRTLKALVGASLVVLARIWRPWKLDRAHPAANGAIGCDAVRNGIGT